MPFQNYRQRSRDQWGVTTDDALTLEQINTGAILRIADATELMATRHTELIRERDHFASVARHMQAELDRMTRSNAALRGHLKRLKKKG
jgi:hypothetical protein